MQQSVRGLGTEGRVAVGILIGLFVLLGMTTLAKSNGPEEQARIAALMVAGNRSGGAVSMLEPDQWRTTAFGEDRFLVRGLVSVPSPVTEAHLRKAFVARVHIPSGVILDEPALLAAVESFSFQ